jgi:thioredoxin 1
MAPVIDDVATEYAGKAKVGKLDVDQNPGAASRYQVRGIPTLLLFKNGQVVEQVVGAVGKDKVSAMLSGHV